MGWLHRYPLSLQAGWFILLYLSAVSLRAEVIAADDFDYNGTAIRGCSGGFGWADAWSGGNLISRGSLYFSDYDAKGNRLTTIGDSKGGSDSIKCSFRTLEVGPEHLATDGKLGKPETTLWLGFIVNIPSGQSYRGAFGGVSLFDDRKEQLFLGDCGSTNVWGFERAGQLQRFSSVPIETGIAFLVYRIEFQATDVKVTLWVNPKPGALDPSALEAATTERVRPFQFNRVRVCSGPEPIDIDGLRIGTTFADVAPKARP